MSQSIADSCFIRPGLKDREQFLMKIDDAKKRRTEMLSDNGELDWGSDDDDVYYDADTEEEKPQHWLNNQICGTFNRWKCQSVLPLGEFIRRIRKNHEPSTRIVQVDKDIYE